MGACQVTLVSLDELVCVKHPYRKFVNLFDFKDIEPVLEALDGLSNYWAFEGSVRLFKCLLLQFMEDLSDRELERYLK